MAAVCVMTAGNLDRLIAHQQEHGPIPGCPALPLVANLVCNSHSHR